MNRSEYWLNFVTTDDAGNRSTMPHGIPVDALSGSRMNVRQQQYHAPALAAFAKDIEKLGGLASIKPGTSVVIGKAGSFDIEIRRINRETF